MKHLRNTFTVDHTFGLTKCLFSAAVDSFKMFMKDKPGKYDILVDNEQQSDM